MDQPDYQSDFYQKILQEITLLKQEIREIEQTVPQTVSLKKKQAGKRLELSDKFRDLLKYSAARKEIQKADSLYQEVGSLQGEANCLQGLAKIKMAQKKYPEAKKYLEKAKEYYQKIGDQYSLGNNHCLMGDLFQEQGLTSEALREYRAALKLFRRIGLKRETGIIENLMNKLT
ncbi:MAG: tetratricopeptide repeat protein [bacterium]